jgi:hypothetical protein
VSQFYAVTLRFRSRARDPLCLAPQLRGFVGFGGFVEIDLAGAIEMRAPFI